MDTDMVSMNMLHRRMQNCKGKGVEMVSMNLLWREKYVEMWESESFENGTQKMVSVKMLHRRK